jgi:hypothetical protein
MEGSSNGGAWEDVDYSGGEGYPKQVAVNEKGCIRVPIRIRHIEPRQNAGDASCSYECIED